MVDKFFKFFMVDKFYIDFIAVDKDAIIIDNCIIKAKSRTEALIKLSDRISPAKLVKFKISKL